MRIFFLIFITLLYCPELFSQDEPIMPENAFVSYIGNWSGEYFFENSDKKLDTADLKIDVEITPVADGIAISFLMTSPDGNTKEDYDSIFISEDRRELNMGHTWKLLEIIVDHGDTGFIMDRKVTNGSNEIHYMRSILQAGPERFVIITAARKEEGEYYYIEEIYRFTRK